MRRSTHVLPAFLALGLSLLGATRSGAEPASRWRIGKPHRVKVTHTTRVRVPDGTARVRVFHAEPLRRAWPGIDAPSTAEKAVFVPTGAIETSTRSEGGFAWKWEVPEPPVGEAEYVSTFEFVSVDRELKTAGLTIRWADLPKDLGEAMKGLPALPVANARVRDAAAQIRKKSKDVVDALEGFSQWVTRTIAYVPGAGYPTDDLDAICRGGGGHCGHRATVYLALCQAAGIPARRVVGYALLNGPPGAAGVDDGNRHVWVQVSLPELGWVEVEPAPHGSPFAIAWPFVMCPFDLQARFVAAVAKNGSETSPIVADTVRAEEVR